MSSSLFSPHLLHQRDQLRPVRPAADLPRLRAPPLREEGDRGRDTRDGGQVREGPKHRQGALQGANEGERICGGGDCYYFLESLLFYMSKLTHSSLFVMQGLWYST